MEIEDIFEEWNAYSKSKRLKPRDMDFGKMIKYSDIKIVGLTGIRRSGKSSVMMLLYQELAKRNEKVCYINMEDDRLKSFENPLDALLKWFGGNGYMLLDEITSIRDWEGWLARVHEQLKGKLKLIVSSSIASFSMPNKPLRGRILDFELYPLSFKEYLAFRGTHIEKTTAGKGVLEKAFKEYLLYGGFPEVASVDGSIDKIRIISSYFFDIVGLDVAEASSEEISLVDTFARYLLQSSYFSASKCMNFISGLGYKAGKEKFLRLERYSQTAYLFFFSQIFSKSIKAIKQYPRKVYAGDTGFYHGITGREDLGTTFETLVYLELRRRLKQGSEISYFKDKEGHEADFIIRNGNSVEGIFQASYYIKEDKTMDREVAGSIAAAKALGLKKALIITMGDSHIKENSGIKLEFANVIDWILSK